MERHPHPEDLFDFPCDHIFKVFGEGTDDFVRSVREAVSAVVPVPLDAIKLRRSSGGTYLCVSLLIRVQNYPQLTAIYAALQNVPGLRYLL